MEYNDLILTIRGDRTRGHLADGRIEVFNGDTGKVETLKSMAKPQAFAADSFLSQLGSIRNSIDTLIRSRQADSNELHKFGCELFDALFRDELLDVWTEAVRMATAFRRGLRIRLILDPELQVLPWELLRRTDVAAKPSLSNLNFFTLVRSTDKLGNHNASSIELPMRILVAVCAPQDHQPIRVRDEIDRLLSALSELIAQGKVSVDFVHGADTLVHLRGRFNREIYHVLHFIGHGAYQGGRGHLVFEDQTRNARFMSSQQIYQFMLGWKPRLVVLNACQGAYASESQGDRNREGSPFTSVADGLVSTEIPAVIAHQFVVSDDGSEVFTRELYRQLADRIGVDEALSFARQFVPVEWFSPVLFLDSRSGELFELSGENPVVDTHGHLKHAAKQAAGRNRWSEALDYAREALIIRKDDQELQALEQRALSMVEGADALHEAGFAERNGDWAGAWQRYRSYESADSGVERSPQERERVRWMKTLAQAGMGARDPELRQWRG